MPCFVEPAAISSEEYITLMLCRACKFLTKEQMQSIDNIDIYISLYQWYLEHLLNDVAHNENNQEEQKIAINEAKRLGASIEKTENGSWCLNYE